jgi:hypothetical protein
MFKIFRHLLFFRLRVGLSSVLFSSGVSHQNHNTHASHSLGFHHLVCIRWAVAAAAAAVVTQPV